MRQKDIEMIKIRTTITLKKINITVRFPCSISFAVKNEDSVVQHNGVYDLLNGLSLINETIETEFEIGNKNGKYGEKKIQLLLFMISTNGKIPAGIVTLNPLERVLTDRKVPIQKCPDKNASASYTLNFQRLQSFEIVSDNRMKLKPLRLQTQSEDHNENFLRNSFRKNVNQTLFKSHVQGFHNDLPKDQLIFSNKRILTSRGTDHKQYKDKWVSMVTSQIDIEARSPKYNGDEFSRKSIIGTLSGEQSDFRTSRASVRVTQTEQNELYSQRNKIMRLQQQKAHYILQMSKLQTSMSQISSADRIQLENQISKVQVQKQQLEDEIQRLKDKSKHHERSEKESINQIKELREQLDKKKNRISQLDSTKSQIQNKISEKDKYINQLQKEKKRLEQSLQQERALQISAQKKIDLKENSYREQLKRINEKYIQSETEKQKSIIDHSNSLGQIEASQKKYQLTLRQKQKAFVQEKNKLTKRIQELTQNNNNLRQHLNEDKILITQLNLQNRTSLDKLRDQQEKFKDLTAKNETLIRELKNMVYTNNVLKDQMAQLKSQLYEDKINYKKKYVEATNQICQQNDKINKMSSLNMSTEAKMKQLNQKLQKQIRQKNILKQKLNESKKIEQKYIQQQQKRQRLAENISTQNTTQAQKVTELKSLLNSQKNKYDTMEKQYEDQVKYLVKSKDYIQNQVQQLKWQLQKQSEKYQILTIKDKQLKEQIISLNHQLIKMQEKITKSEHTLQQKDTTILQLMQSVSDLQLKYKEMNEAIKKKQEENYQIYKKNYQFQEQAVILEETIKQDNCNLKQQIQVLQKNIKQKNCQIQVKNEELLILKKQNDIEKEQIHLLTQNLNTKNNQLIAAGDISKKLRQEYSLLMIKYERLQEQEKVKVQQIEQMQQHLLQKATYVSSGLKQLSQLRSQFQQYKIIINIGLKKLLEELSIEDIDRYKSINIISFPDEALSLLLMNCIKQHQNVVKKYQQQLVDKQKIIDFIDQQMKKQQIYLETRQTQHQQSIQKEKAKLKAEVSEKCKQVEELQHTIEKQMQKSLDYLSQIDYLNSQNNKFENQIEELNRKIKILQEKYRDLKKCNLQMQSQINHFKDKQSKDALLNQQSYEQLNIFYQNQLHKNKNIILSLEQEKKLKQKSIQQKVEIIKKLNQSLQIYEIEKQNIIEELKEITVKGTQENNKRLIAEKQLRESEKCVQEMKEELLFCQQTIQKSQQKEIIYQEELKKVKEDAHIIEHKYTQIKNQQQAQTIALLQRQKRQIEKVNKLDVTKTKLEEENKELRQKCIKFQSQIQLHKFYNVENTKKIEQHENIKDQARLQLFKYKQSLLKSQTQKNQLQNKWYKFEMEVENINKQKVMMADRIVNYEEKIAELQQKNEIYQQELTLQSQKHNDNEKLREIIDYKDQLYSKKLYELKTALEESKGELKVYNNQIKKLQRKLSERPDIDFEKTKWQTALIGERQQFQIKMEKMKETVLILKEQLSFQNDQFTKEIEVANETIQQLNEVTRQKQEKLQIKDHVINQQLIRLDELNIQLNECIFKWSKQKQAYLPTSNKMTELNEEISRMNKFIIDLDGRNKQLLQINKRKMQQKIEPKNSITQMLKQVLLLLQKSKSKILGRCSTDKEKEQVIQQFKVVVNKLDLTLKSTQVAIIVKKQ